MKIRSKLVSFWLSRLAFLIAVIILAWALSNIRLLILQARPA